MWESGHKWLSWWNKVFLLRESSLIRHHYIYSSPLHLFTIIVFTYDHYIDSPPLHLFIIIMCESLNMSPHHEHLSSLQTPWEARAQTRFHHFDLSLASHFSSFQILPTTAISFFYYSLPSFLSFWHPSLPWRFQFSGNKSMNHFMHSEHMLQPLPSLTSS